MGNKWTKYDMQAKIRELTANNIIMFTENNHLKTLNEQANEIIVQMRKERNYWHEMATKGGGNG